MIPFLGKIFNVFLSYAGWLVCIHSVANHHPFWGFIGVLFLLILHFFSSPSKIQDFQLMMTLALFGTLLDSSYIWCGVLKYQEGYLSAPWIAPFWITCLWALFSISFNHSLTWLEDKWALSAAMGALGGPSTYLVAVKLGAAEFLLPQVIGLGIIGGIWFFLFPLLFAYNKWLKNFSKKSDSPGGGIARTSD